MISSFTPRGPDDPAPPTVVAVVSSSQSVGTGGSAPLPLLLVAALLLSLLLVGVAATPPGLLPRQMGFVVNEHREALLTGGLVTATSITVGLAIAMLGS